MVKNFEPRTDGLKKRAQDDLANGNNWIKRLKHNERVLPRDDDGVHGRHSGDEPPGTPNQRNHLGRKEVFGREKELDGLEEKFQMKLRTLHLWRDAEEKAINEKYAGVCGGENGSVGPQYESFNYEPSQFLIENGRTACATISVLAVCMFLKNRSTSVEELKWGELVKAGADVWGSWFESHRKEMMTKAVEAPPDKRRVYERESDRMIQTAREVFEFKPIEDGTKGIAMIKEIGGTLDTNWLTILSDKDATEDYTETFYTLENAVAEFTKIRTRVGMAFSIRGSTVSVMREENSEVIYLFDSHGGERPGHSVLIKFQNSDSLVKYIRHRNPVSQGTHYSTWNGEAARSKNVFSMSLFTKASATRT
jgi:hypothetical protein